MEYQRLLNRPEELIRFELMEKLTHHLHFPSHLLVKERAISQLPHISQEFSLKKKPNNLRIDLLAYHWHGENLHPLVLFECKHLRPDERAFQQLIAYNQWIKAPFLAWVSKSYEGLYRMTKNGLVYLGALKPFEDLCQLSRN
ncbi:MAG: type I restriction enzyme HsdR N-terminal domain-containing protein [Chlamydiae bacterium]|nr:type I restriction enzyme HsdR N-terminal domain-containing protein [Chlamydiota bacterium]